MSDDVKLTPRALTIGDQRALMDEALDRNQAALDNPAENGRDSLSDGYFEDITLHEVAAICDCQLADLDGLTGDELKKLADQCKEKNRYFFEMRAREREQGQRLMEKNPELIKTIMEMNAKKSTTLSSN